MKWDGSVWVGINFNNLIQFLEQDGFHVMKVLSFFEKIRWYIPTVSKTRVILYQGPAQTVNQITMVKLATANNLKTTNTTG